MYKIFLLVAICCSAGILSSPILPHQQMYNEPWSNDLAMEPRQRRESINVIDDCMMVTSQEGLFYYKASPAEDLSMTCGLYLITDPEKRVEITLTHLDIACQDGGLLSMVDGWEMGHEYFPSVDDHPIPLEERIVSECGTRQTKTHIVSSQNAALVQYRVPKAGQGFTLRVRFVKNPKPCNILVEGTAEVYTLSNHGSAVNCSVTTLFPASISLISLDVGASALSLFGHPLLRSTNSASHQCQEKGMKDYVQIGGSSGFDTTKMAVADSVCGVARNIKTTETTIGCGITTVRLVSSGHFTNVVHISIRPAQEDDLFSATFMCDA